MKLPGVLFAAIEKAFNTLITDQPGIVPPELNRQMVCIDLTGMDAQIFFYFIDTRVIVLTESDHGPDATICGTPIALALAGRGNAQGKRDIQLSGDLHIAQAFERLLSRIEVDWEEILSQYTGDTIAFHIGETVRGLRQWGHQSASAFADDLRDYLQIETSQLPLPAEVDDFNLAVDDMRASVERFELRVQRLQRRLAIHEETSQ